MTAHARKLYTKSEVPDAIMAILEFESGPLGYIGTGWASPGVYSMNLLGTKANLMYDLDFTHWDESHQADDWSTLRSQFYGESVRQPVELPRTDMFREQLEEFALATRGRGDGRGRRHARRCTRWPSSARCWSPRPVTGRPCSWRRSSRRPAVDRSRT